jgi:hypothetical protein
VSLTNDFELLNGSPNRHKDENGVWHTDIVIHQVPGKPPLIFYFTQ